MCACARVWVPLRKCECRLACKCMKSERPLVFLVPAFSFSLNVPPCSFQIANFLSHPSLKMDIRCALADSRGSSKRSEPAFDKEEVFSREQIQHINRNIDSVRLALKARFPNVSQAISSWKRSDKGVKMRWKPLPPSLQ